MSKQLGKISHVKFGIGGYQDCCLGIFFSFSFDGTGCNSDKSAWDKNRIKHTAHSKWSEDDRSKQYAEIMRYVSDLLSDAKVESVDKLKGVPIEAEFDGMKLVSWRILKEVL